MVQVLPVPALASIRVRPSPASVSRVQSSAGGVFGGAAHAGSSSSVDGSISAASRRASALQGGMSG